MVTSLPTPSAPKAALVKLVAMGAEGVGKDIDMIIGNGYTKGHAEITLQELRENADIRDIFDKKYV